MLAGCAAWVGHKLLQARDHLEQARSALQSARTELADQATDKADSSLAVAKRETGLARAATDDFLVAVSAHVPLLGRSVVVARGLAAVSDDLARTVLPDAATGVRLLSSGALRRPDGTVDLNRFVDSGGRLAASAARSHRLAAQLRALPTSLVLAQVGDARSTLQGQLDQLDGSLAAARDTLVIVPRFLGGDRPRTYFVMVQQTSESRGTGGLPGGFVVLRADHGRMTVVSKGSDADLKAGRIEPVGLHKDYVSQYGDLGAFDIWQNINLSPDLPVVSRYLTQRWKAQTGQALDGVIALDAAALADLLQGSGPITLPSGTVLQPADLPEYLAIGQYAGVQSVADSTGTTARKQGLVGIAGQVLDRVTRGGGDSGALLNGVRTALSTGHLRMTTDDPLIGPLLHAQHVDGGLPGKDAAFVYPVVFNSAGNKMDYFLKRTVAYERLSCAGHRRRTRVTVTLRTDPPALNTLPAYVTYNIGGRETLQTLDTRVALSVYATAGSTLRSARLNGKPLSRARTADLHITTLTEAGLPLWRSYLDLPAHQDLVLSLDLDEPSLAVPGTVFKEQPLARAQTSSSDVPACT